MSSCSNLDLENSKSIFLHDTLTHNDASPYQGLITKGSAVEEILSRYIFTGILNLFCDLDLDHNRAIQSFHKTIQLLMMCHQSKFSCKRISSSDNILKSHIFILSLTVTLILKTANQSFWKTIWLIMMHHHAKFGYTKQFSNSEKIIWTIIHWHCKMLLWPWPSTQNPNFSIRHSG